MMRPSLPGNSSKSISHVAGINCRCPAIHRSQYSVAAFALRTMSAARLSS